MDSFGFGEVMVGLGLDSASPWAFLPSCPSRRAQARTRRGQILTGRRTAGARGLVLWTEVSDWAELVHRLGPDTYVLLDRPPAQTQGEARVRPRQIEALSSAACMPSRGPPGLRDAAAGLVGDPSHYCPVSVPAGELLSEMHALRFYRVVVLRHPVLYTHVFPRSDDGYFKSCGFALHVQLTEERIYTAT